MAKEKNTWAVPLAWCGLVTWLLLLWPASTVDTGLLRWHAHMHWSDKLFWYVYMAAGPALAGFLSGAAFGHSNALRKVHRKCKTCGDKFEIETMRWGWDPGGGEQESGSWQCQKCCEAMRPGL